jgi:hypothetical protein
MLDRPEAQPSIMNAPIKRDSVEVGKMNTSKPEVNFSSSSMILQENHI